MTGAGRGSSAAAAVAWLTLRCGQARSKPSGDGATASTYGAMDGDI